MFSRNLASSQASSLLSHLVVGCVEKWHETDSTGADLSEFWRDSLGERERLESLFGGRE